MFRMISEILESRERRALIQEERALIRAKAQHELTRASLSGAVIVPAGSAFVRPANLAVDIDVIPALQNVSRTPIAYVNRQNPAPQVDLCREGLQLGRATAILAGQQLGKTFTARHIAAAWAREGREVWFIGPKWCHGEWGSTVTMWGPDWDDIEAGLVEVAKEAKRRRERVISEGGRTQDCPPRLIVIDDWTEVAYTLGKSAQSFVISATTMFASCNLIPLFCGHADTSAAWGTDRIGKALTENFLRIRVHRTASGEREYGVLYPTQSEKRPDGQLVYPQYGWIPDGEPVWPRTNERTETRTSDDYGYSPEKQAQVRSVRTLNSRSQFALPKAAPRMIEVKTERGKWKRIELTARDGELARRAFEIAKTLSGVVEKMKVSGHRKVKLEIAKALLEIPSDGWRYVEGGQS